MALGDREIPRRQVRQGGGRGTGEDHVDGMYGCTELFVYLTPNTRPKGYESLKSYLESQDCEVVAGAEAPAELERHEAIRITHGGRDPIPIAAVKRVHSWAHRRNYLHSFFRPMYR